MRSGSASLSLLAPRQTSSSVLAHDTGGGGGSSLSLPPRQPSSYASSLGYSSSSAPSDSRAPAARSPDHAGGHRGARAAPPGRDTAAGALPSTSRQPRPAGSSIPQRTRRGYRASPDPQPLRPTDSAGGPMGHSGAGARVTSRSPTLTTSPRARTVGRQGPGSAQGPPGLAPPQAMRAGGLSRARGPAQSAPAARAPGGARLDVARLASGRAFPTPLTSPPTSARTQPTPRATATSLRDPSMSPRARPTPTRLSPPSLRATPAPTRTRYSGTVPARAPGGLAPGSSTAQRPQSSASLQPRRGAHAVNATIDPEPHAMLLPPRVATGTQSAWTAEPSAAAARRSSSPSVMSVRFADLALQPPSDADADDGVAAAGSPAARSLAAGSPAARSPVVRRFPPLFLDDLRATASFDADDADAARSPAALLLADVAARSPRPAAASSPVAQVLQEHIQSFRFGLELTSSMDSSQSVRLSSSLSCSSIGSPSGLRGRRGTYKYVYFEDGVFRHVCPNCKNDRAESGQKLLLLDCHCSLCATCCEALLHDGALQCPRCARATHVGDRGVAALCPNYALADLCALRTDMLTSHRDTCLILDEIGAFCPVCLTAYGEGDVPCLLSCGHSMCAGCRRVVGAECPQCRAQLRGSFDHVNIPLLQALQTIVSLKRTLAGPPAE